MSTDLLLQLLVYGLANGLIIALVALGYTMVYGIIELINFAHGDLVMLGCFASLSLIVGLGLPHWSPWVSIPLLLLVVPAFSAAVNWSIDRFAYRPLRGAPKVTALVSAIGVSFILVNLGLFWAGTELLGGGSHASEDKNVPRLLANTNLLGTSNVTVMWREVLVVAVTIPLMLALRWFVTRTRLGTAMRAVAQHPQAARLMGIDVDRVIGVTFVIGGALAGVASVITALYNGNASFLMGYTIGIDAFTAAVLGGIGNLPGAVLGGLVIGLVKAAVEGLVPDGGQWSTVSVFTVLVLILVFRPSGILGARVREKV